jgi:serine-type D-Ala-D-Ala carboxypeptidase/endopeptidase
LGQRATEFTPGFPFVGGAGALRSTLRDMMRYLEFELGEVRSPLSSLLPALHRVRHAFGPRDGIGLGWHIQQLPDGAPIISKGGAMPGYSSFIIFAPFSRTGAVVLSNQARCGVEKIGTSLMRRLNGLQTQPAVMAPPQEDDP